MNAIMGFNDLLQQSQAQNPKAFEILQLTQQSGERLLTVINDVLDYSQFQLPRHLFLNLCDAYVQATKPVSNLGLLPECGGSVFSQFLHL
jgi:signal transduction histidine kinase